MEDAVAPDAVRAAVRFMVHYQGREAPDIRTPLPSNVMAQNVHDEFAALFMAECKTFPVLRRLVQASEYLGVTALHKLALTHLVSCTLGTNEEQLKAVFEVGISYTTCRFGHGFVLW